MAETTPPVARVSGRRRLSAIWLIPLVAVAIGGWLAWDTLSKKGPTIKVSFQTAEGLEAGKSLLKFKDIVFGTVQALRLSDDHKRVEVTIATTRQAEPLLDDQTEFWVVKPRLFAGSVSGLDTLLSGSYVGMRPGPANGKARREFVGKEDPPILETDTPGTTFQLKAARLGSISLGSPVFFRDLSVGEVLGWDIADMAESVTLHVFIRAPFDKYVRDNTRFWNASGISVKLGANGVDVQMESLRALLLGGVAFDTPKGEGPAASPVTDNVFPLFADRDAATAASYTRKIPAVSYFPGSVNGLAPGSKVTMHGLVVGHVTDVRLHYDLDKNAILAPVRFEVEPERIVGVGVQHMPTDMVVQEVVSRGLRASLQSASLITGQQEVALEFVKDAPPATATKEGNDFVIPTTESAGFATLTSSATDVLNKINTMPFNDIGKALLSALKGVAETVHDPDIQKTLRRLPEVETTLQGTLTTANKAMLSFDNGYGNNSQFNRDVERLMAQLNDATRSIRALADLLARNPEALVKGRAKGAQE